MKIELHVWNNKTLESTKRTLKQPENFFEEGFLEFSKANIRKADIDLSKYNVERIWFADSKTIIISVERKRK